MDRPNATTADGLELWAELYSDAPSDRMLRAAVGALAAVAGARDPYLSRHHTQVARYSRAMASHLGFDPWEIDGIGVAASIHDVGKLAVPAEMLAKPGRLSAAEITIVQSHCRIGFDILREIPFPWQVPAMVLQHHERFDGSGYPGGLRRDDIVVGARIIAVADVVEAMASHRPYRPALGIAAALEEIVRGRNTAFDPDAVDACVSLFEDGTLSVEDWFA